MMEYQRLDDAPLLRIYVQTIHNHDFPDSPSIMSVLLLGAFLELPCYTVGEEYASTLCICRWACVKARSCSGSVP
jgi:hypothetical protein